MSEQLAVIAHLEILGFLGLLATIVFYKGLVSGPGLASLLTSTNGGPIHSERLVLLLFTVFSAGQYFTEIVHAGGTLPDIPAALLGLISASNGVYLGAKQFR